MKENEAKDILNEIMELDDSMAQYNLAYMKAMEVAIKALEEVQQYRALGTVEKLTANMEELKRWHTDKIAPNVKNPFAYTSTLCCCNCDHKDEYIEELEAEVEEYQQIGTPEECRAAREKQMPKRPKEYEDKYYGCPTCGNVLLHKWEKYPDKLMDKSNGLLYCLGCGQKLNWEDEE